MSDGAGKGRTGKGSRATGGAGRAGTSPRSSAARPEARPPSAPPTAPPTAPPSAPSDEPAPTAAAFGDRLLASTLSAVEILSVYLGDRLGWYQALAQADTLTPEELAGVTDTQERYAREWLEQQAAVGILELVRPGPDGGQAAFRLPPAHAEVLTDERSLAFTAPMARFFGAIGPKLPRLLEAYRHGGGVSWAELGDDARESQSAGNRPWYEHRLGSALASVPAVHDVLARPGARVLDVGCGMGWSTISLARAYPEARLVGIDVDAPSITSARANARAEGVEERVEFRAADAAELAAQEPFDAAFAFECVHDMPRPVEVLGAVRAAVRPDGAVVVMDEAVADELTAPADQVDRLMYGYSLFVCLPDSLSSPPSVATGTVMRPATLRRYAQDAGFADVEVLPIEDFSFFRFYRLLP
ncbi:class I SAM-dependent methyltransferase [Puerhibacterium puerhi]|uniref:class I SAM-dependent methyltransferase n=1 Tax=Puerhibacterium puerhi TaxID=2692623 RepID=UPI001357ADEE|nr:class I SAM-dependent methyltransferase [Puerhibacterium puerhi]